MIFVLGLEGAKSAAGGLVWRQDHPVNSTEIMEKIRAYMKKWKNAPNINLSRCAYESHNVTAQVPTGVQGFHSWHPPRAWQDPCTQRYSSPIHNKDGEAAQNCLAIFPPAGSDSVGLWLCVNSWLSHSLPLLHASALGQATELGLHPDAPLLEEAGRQ